MAGRTEWDRINEEIINQTDIEAAYADWGVKFTAKPPSASGWKECHAIDREDSSPSAAVNVGRTSARGRYKDLGGDGLSLGFFDFAARFGGFSDWREARRHFATAANLSLPRGAEPKNPLDALEFRDWSNMLVEFFCDNKRGVTGQAVQEAGGRLAAWPKGSARPQSVVAFPGFGDGSLDADPCAWVIMEASGKNIEVFLGKGKVKASRKIHTVGGSRGGLMNVFALARLETAEVIWKCEGVSDMLALHGLIAQSEYHGRHVVVTNSGGCQEAVRPEWAERFRGRVVYVLHDADRPGQIGAAKWVDGLSKTVAEVRNVVLPYAIEENHGQDVRDWALEGHTYAELLALAADCPPKRGVEILKDVAGGDGASLGGFGPGGPGTNGNGVVGNSTQVLTSIRLDVLGEYPNNSIEVFSHTYHKLVKIHDINRLGYASLVQICGEVVHDHVDDSKEPDPAKVSMATVRNTIALEAGKFRLNDSTVLGVGCWAVEPQKDPAVGERQNRQWVVIVDTQRAGVWDGDEFRLTSVPRVGSVVLDFGSGEAWCDFAAVERSVREQTGDRARQTLDEATRLFAQWNWRAEAQAELVAALVACTWVQTLWRWRPLVSLSGPSDSGKSTLLEILEKLFGKLALLVSKTTEAGLRQAVQNTARVLMIDEFENDAHRAKVLELLRTASRGSKIPRGTADQRGRWYGLKHIPYLAAIETGLTKEADVNRFIKLELSHLSEEKRGRVELPSDAEVMDLGFRLLGVAVRHILQAVPVAEKLKGTRLPGVNGRTVECYSAPAAMLAVVRGLGMDDARMLLERLVRSQDNSKKPSRDEMDLLRTILSSPLAFPGGRQFSVRQVLVSRELYTECDGQKFLERSGIALSRRRRGPKPSDPNEMDELFIVPEVVQRYLLRGTRWSEGDLDQLLRRLPNAEACQRRCGGGNLFGITIPKELGELVPEDGLDGGSPGGVDCGSNNSQTIEVPEV
jgi:hypothetical protein